MVALPSQLHACASLVLLALVVFVLALPVKAESSGDSDLCIADEVALLQQGQAIVEGARRAAGLSAERAPRSHPRPKTQQLHEIQNEVHDYVGLLQSMPPKDQETEKAPRPHPRPKSQQLQEIQEEIQNHIGLLQVPSQVPEGGHADEVALLQGQAIVACARRSAGLQAQGAPPPKPQQLQEIQEEAQDYVNLLQSTPPKDQGTEKAPRSHPRPKSQQLHEIQENIQDHIRLLQFPNQVPEGGHADEVALLQQGQAVVAGARRAAGLDAGRVPRSQSRPRLRELQKIQEEVHDCIGLLQSSFLKQVHSATKKRLAEGTKAESKKGGKASRRKATRK